MDSPDRRRLHHRTGGRLRQHKKHLLFFGLGLLLIAVITVQLLYPHDRALPLARLDGKDVGYMKTSDVLARLQTAFLNGKVTLHGAGKTTVTKTLTQLGATADSEDMAAKLSRYDPGWRFVPFSILFMRPDVRHLDAYFDDSQLRAEAVQLAKALSTPPADARLSVKDGRLVTTPAADGFVVTAAAVRQALSSAELTFATTDLTPKGATVGAAYTDTDLAPVRQQADLMIHRRISLVDELGHEYTPDAATLASWLVIKTKPDHSVAVSVDPKAVAAYAAKINADLAVPAGMTTVHVRDGIETGREVGKEGYAVATKALVDGLIKAVQAGDDDPQLVITYVPTPPRLAYDRQYSSSQAGLRAYVQYVTNTEDVHIALAQLDGNRWTASGRATESIPSASTYKLYVSMILFDKISQGEIKWSDTVVNDTDVSTCLEQMIVLSLNECAEQFIANFGRTYIDNYLHAHGISAATTFTAQGAVRTSAADLLTTLEGLENGTLYSGSTRSTLLEKMGRQVYRQGVPTGSGGSVQDKVGFLWGYLHDAAIVHTSKGTYAVAIMTNNASWTRIAQITTQLERIMYP